MKRRAQSGTVEQMGNGRFRVRVQIDGQRVTVTPRGGVRTRAIAQEYLDGIGQAAEALAEEHEITVAEFSARFMARRSTTVRASTYRRDLRAMALIRTAFGGAAVDAVDAPLVTQIRNRWISEAIELQDNTVYYELSFPEDWGFCEPGEAESLLESGATAPGGRLPINPSGGFLSFGEATTAQGIFQVCEIASQLRGEAGGRQVPDAKVGLGQTLGLGGNGAAVILKR